jgi:hypothetical protein
MTFCHRVRSAHPTIRRDWSWKMRRQKSLGMIYRSWSVHEPNLGFVRMSDCCLQGIQPCECKGKGYQWVGNQVFRLGSRKEWDLWGRDLQKSFGEFKTVNSILLTNYCSHRTEISTNDIVTQAWHRALENEIRMNWLWSCWCRCRCDDIQHNQRKQVACLEWRITAQRNRWSTVCNNKWWQCPISGVILAPSG